MAVQLTPRPARPDSGPVVRSDVNVFGEVDGYLYRPRILVPRTVFLSFAELLGMVVETLLWEDLQDECEVLRAVRYCLVDHTGSQVREDAARAMALLGGCTDDPQEARFVAHAAMVVTRVFGITCPALADASTALSAVRTDVDLNGERCRFNSAPRIAVAAPLWLSLADLVGLLALAPESGLTERELDQDDTVRRLLWVEVTDATWDSMRALADRAAAILAAQANDPDVFFVAEPDAWFVAATATAVTRVFAITA